MMGQALGRRLDRLSEGRFAVVAIAPGLLLVALVVVPPLAAALGLSLFREFELTRDDITPFVGLRNYATRLPADADFLRTLPRTVVFSLLVTLIAVPVALGAALLIARSGVRTATALWLFLVVPWAVAPVASGIFWRMQFDPKTGLVNDALRALGLPTVALDSATGSLLALGVAVIWRAIRCWACCSWVRSGRCHGTWAAPRGWTAPARGRRSATSRSRSSHPASSPRASSRSS